MDDDFLSTNKTTAPSSFIVAPGEAISGIDVSSDGSLAAVISFSEHSGSSVYLISTRTGRIEHKIEHNFAVAASEFSPIDSSILVTVSDQIRIFHSGKLISVLNPHTSTELVEVCPFTGIDFESKGRYFAVTDVRGFCSVWNLHDESPIEVFQLVDEIMYSVSFVTEHIIGVVSESGKLFVIDRRTHAAVCSESDETVPACQPRLLAWDRSTTAIAIGNQMSGKFSVYQQKSLQDPLVLVGNGSFGKKSISAIAWANDGEYLVVARDSGMVEVWNGNGPFDAPLFQNEVGTSGFGVSAIAPLGNRVLVGTSHGHVIVSKLPESNRRRSGGGRRFGDSPEKKSYPALA